MSKLPDRYNSKEAEKKWQKYWQEKQIFAWKNDLPKEQTFIIDTPPPTVSGVLHMGHVFSYTQADFVARFQRMLGKDVFYPMGFDDNGLPTERLVEKIIGKKARIFESENGHGSFILKCQEIVIEAEKEFEELFNTIAISVDWNQKYQTISPESQKISQASFIDLFNKGLVERKFEPVFWDISDRTALAQADLVDKEVEGIMNYIEFMVEGLDGKIQIMTTRPELLPACVAVMIHPEDPKFFHLIKKSLDNNSEGKTGSFAITPLFGVKVPIIADKMVQMDKGTGAVMCCTFGDETDIKWWRKHNLPFRVVIAPNGKMCDIGYFEGDGHHFQYEDESRQSIIVTSLDDDAGCFNNKNCLDVNLMSQVYQNLIFSKNIKQAQASIIQSLKENSLLKNQEKITRSVKCAERSGTPIEILIDDQWFIKILDKKEQLKKVAKRCNFYPDYMKVRLEQWIDGLAWDWCISRQRFFGVKFPVWYSKRQGEEGKILVATQEQLEKATNKNQAFDPEIELPIDHKNQNGTGFYSRDEVSFETDIMDTWATSSISPQLSSKGISAEICFDQERHQKLFPADLRPQAHEIIRTWAFYTLTKAYLHSLDKNGEEHKSPDQRQIELQIPWQNLMISGWCLAADKTKMSKSKGNVVTPTALIEEKGSDIVRYWASTSNLGADTAYSEEVFKIGQKLTTKLFNAAKFASINFAILNQDSKKQNITEALDLWILARLHQTIKITTLEFKKFEYAKARQEIENFFWNDFCDNYLEICKVRSYGLDAEKWFGVTLSDSQQKQILSGQQSAVLTLKTCLNNLLKLFAPFIPHLCEEIYSTLFIEEFTQTKSINARGNWVKLSEELINQKSLVLGELALAIIFEVRKFKSEKNLSMKTPIELIKINQSFLLEKLGENKLENGFKLLIEDLKNVCNAKEIELAIKNSVSWNIEIIL